MAVVSLAPIETFLPIISFLFVFIVVFALLKKTEILGNNNFTALFLSFIVASFFIVNSQLVEFVKLSTSWVAVFIICLFLIMMFIGLAGKDSLEIFTKNKSLAWVLVGLMVILFAVSSSYIFNWAINWELIQTWFDKDWFGVVVLLILAGVISKVLIEVKK